jgi:hypothetical protein
MENRKHPKQDIVNNSFIVLVLFILLAIILGAVFI